MRKYSNRLRLRSAVNKNARVHRDMGEGNQFRVRFDFIPPCSAALFLYFLSSSFPFAKNCNNFFSVKPHETCFLHWIRWLLRNFFYFVSIYLSWPAQCLKIKKCKEKVESRINRQCFSMTSFGAWFTPWQ